jgi:hypothetical protein
VFDDFENCFKGCTVFDDVSVFDDFLSFDDLGNQRNNLRTFLVTLCASKQSIPNQ